MKPIYFFLLVWALFITGLSDGIAAALFAIPGLGVAMGLAVVFCINSTMGMGLVYLLFTNGMYHPKFGPAGLVAGLVPPFNVLPVWVGLVIAGIIHDKATEKGALGEAATLADTLQSNKNPLSKAQNTVSAGKNMERLSGRPPISTEANDEGEEVQEKSRSPLNLKSPTGMNNDIARPPSAANDNNQLHAKAA